MPQPEEFCWMGVVGLAGSPFGSSGTHTEPKREILGQKLALFGPWVPEKARYQAKVCGNHEVNPGRAAGGSWDQIWSSGALLGPLGPPKGTFSAQTGPFGAPGDPEEGRYQAKVCGNHVTNPVGPIGGS